MDATARSPLRLASMPQLLEARAPEDDWTGTISPEERRRRQNRLNQRARRRRQAQNASSNPSTTNVGPQRRHALPSATLSSVVLRDASGTQAAAPMIRLVSTNPFDLLSIFSPEQIARLADQSIVPLDRHIKLKDSTLARWFAYVARLLEKALSPLSADKLLTLTTFNVVRGLTLNLIILGGDSPHECERSHAFTRWPSRTLPRGLMPTEQQKKLHPAWIDLFPAPRIRDNIIEHLGRFDRHKLCNALLGGVCSDEDDDDMSQAARMARAEIYCESGLPGLLLWSDPWDIRGWEATPAFVYRWGWVLAGCTEIFESTNRWRALRGEPPLYPLDPVTRPRLLKPASNTSI